jgi:calpain-15
MQEVVVDDLFPFDDTPEVDHWAFAKASNDCEVYVMVLEKAIAKVFGSYEAIESGKPHQAFMMLTGFPSDIIYSNRTNPYDLWASLLEATSQDQMALATVNSSTNGLTKSIRTNGLPNHLSCRVVDLFEIKLTPKSSVKLLKIKQNITTFDKFPGLPVWEATSKQWLKEVQKQRKGEV